VADVKAPARELTLEAMNTLKGAMANPKAPWSAKITAAIAVLDRGWGKPEQTVSANLSVFDQMTDDEQKTMLAALEALKGDQMAGVGPEATRVFGRNAQTPAIRRPLANESDRPREHSHRHGDSPL
jgi:hypothetical protein